MTKSVELSLFDELANQFLELQSTCSPSFFHGWMAGGLAAGLQLEKDSLIKEVQVVVDPQVELPNALQDQAIAMYAELKSGYEDTLMPMQPLLPDEQDGMEMRVQSLGQWCEGFLAGIGGSGRLSNSDVTNEVREMLEDLMAISQVELDADDPDNAHNFIQVLEHAKVIAYGLYFEFNGQLSNQGDSHIAQDKPTLH